MRITMAMVFDGLNKRFTVIKGKSFQAGTHVNGVRIAGGKLDEIGATGRNSDVIVCDHATMDRPSSNYKSAQIVLVDSAQALEASQEKCALIVMDSAGLFEVADEVSQILRKYRDWADALVECAVGDFSINKLIEQAHVMLDNPLIVVDRSLHVWGYSSQDAMNDPIWPNRQGDGNYVDSSVSNEIDTKEFFDEISRERFIGKYPVFSGNIMSAGVIADNGHAVIVACLVQKETALTIGYQQCFKYFCDIAGICLKASSSIELEDEAYSQLLVDIITGRTTDAHEIESRAGNLDISIGKNFVIGIVKPVKGKIYGGKLEKISELVKQTVAGAYPLIVNHDVVAVMNANDDLAFSQAAAKTISQQFSQHGLRFSYSRQGRSLMDLAQLYQQAEIAQRIAQKMHSSAGLVSFEAYRSLNIFDTCLEHGSISEYMSPAFSILEEYDNQTKSSLVQTLVCLLENDCVQSKAAKELFINRNTLLYRMKRIEDLCDIDLSDNDTLFDLQFSYRLGEYAGVIIT